MFLSGTNNFRRGQAYQGGDVLLVIAIPPVGICERFPSAIDVAFGQKLMAFDGCTFGQLHRHSRLCDRRYDRVLFGIGAFDMPLE